MGVVSTLTVDLRGNSAHFKKTLTKANKSAAKFGKELRAGLNTGMKKLATATGGATAALGLLVTQTAKAAREVRNFSAVANTNVEDFQRMAHGAKQYGVEQDKLADIMKDTQDKIGDFAQTGGGAMADFFENIAPKVGVTAKEFQNLSGASALQLYYDSLEKANLSQADMTFYMEAIAGDAALLAPLLANGGEGFSKMAREADALGLVLSELEIAKLENMNKSVDRVKGVFSGLANQISVQFAPIMTGLINKFTDWAVETNFVGKVAESVFNFVKRGALLVADAIQGWKVVLLGVKVTFEGFKAAMASGINFLANDVIINFGNSIRQFLLAPLKLAVDALAPFSEAARQASAALQTMMNLERIEVLDQFEQTSMSSLNESIAQVKAALTEEMPSTGLMDAFNKIERDATAAAQNLTVSMGVDTEGEFGDKTGEDKEEKTAEEIKAEEDKKNKARLDAMKNFGNAAAQLEKSKNEKMSALGKAAMLANKVMAVKDAMISTGVAVGKGMELGYPMAIPAVAMAVAQGAMNVANIAGIAHGGLDNVPQEGTFLLNKGERVLKPSQNKDLTKFLAKGGGGSVNAQAATPNIENKIEPSVVVVDNEEKMFDALGSDSAAEIHIAQIERNASRYKQALGV